MKPTPELFTDIAREHLNIPTLETRNSDSLDFHDVSVCGVKNALSHAYQAGVNASAENPRLIEKQLTSSAMFHTPGLFRALQNDYRVNGKPRLHAIKTLSNGYGLSREEAAGLLSGAIKSEIDEAAGTVTLYQPVRGVARRQRPRAEALFRPVALPGLRRRHRPRDLLRPRRSGRPRSKPSRWPSGKRSRPRRVSRSNPTTFTRCW